jgi:uncharacterized membrane protein YqjE
MRERLTGTIGYYNSYPYGECDMTTEFFGVAFFVIAIPAAFYLAALILGTIFAGAIAVFWPFIRLVLIGVWIAARFYAIALVGCILLYFTTGNSYPLMMITVYFWLNVVVGYLGWMLTVVGVAH